jgi:hypothetical protein
VTAAPIVPTMTAAAPITTTTIEARDVAPPTRDTHRPATEAPESPLPAISSAPGGAAATGTGVSFLLLFLLAGMAAVARPTARWRLHFVPASWLPAPFLSLLERPG